MFFFAIIFNLLIKKYKIGYNINKIKSLGGRNMCKLFDFLKKKKDNNKKNPKKSSLDDDRVRGEEANLNDSNMRMRNKFRGGGGY